MNLHAVLKFWATRWPDSPALRHKDREISWGELDRSSDQIAAGLYQHGIRKGDRVGILMHNRFEFIQSMLGVMKAGGALVLLNIRFTPTELIYPLKDADIAVVVSELAFADVLGKAQVDLGRELEIFFVDDNLMEGTASFERLLAHGALAPDVEVGADDVALVCYTSGTTGFPKGAMLTHGALREAGVIGNLAMGINYNDRLLISLPLAYTWGSCQFIREALLAGATTVLESSFDADTLMDVMARERITVWSSVPVLFEKIAESPRFREVDLSSLRQVATGNASRHLLETWQGAGVDITQAYGLSETGGHVTILYNEDAQSKLGSSGRAMMHCQVKITDPEGQELPCGEAGEILVKGPVVMKGYLNNPEATVKTIVDGWLWTGDMGYLDDDGFLFVIDRSKDMLKSGGLNVYPAEIERVLAGVPGMEEFAVIGVKDARWGESPMIVAHGKQPIDLAVLTERCTSRLADFKRPRYFLEYGQPLPRTVSGKIIKRQLCEEFPQAPDFALDLKNQKNPPASPECT